MERVLGSGQERRAGEEADASSLDVGAGAAPSRRRIPIAGVVLLALLSCVWSIVLLYPQHGLSLNWDEVDYVNAAREGIPANAFEKGSLSIPAYLRFAYSKLRHHPPNLPAGYDELRDPIKLRHGHSPAVVEAMAPLAKSNSERTVRFVQMVGAVAVTAAMVVTYLVVSTEWSWLALVALLAVLPWYNWHLFGAIEFHGWEAVWLLASVVCLTMWLRTERSSRWGLALCASLVLCVLTLESGVLVVVGVAAALVVWVRGVRRRTDVPWIRSYFLPGLAVVVAGTFVLWPGSVLKASVLKIPLDRVYQVFLGGQDIYYHRPSLDRFSYLLPLAIALPTLAYFFLRRRRDSAAWGPLVLVALVYAVPMMKFAAQSYYFLPGLAPLLVLFAVMISSLRVRAAAAVSAVTLVAMVAISFNLARINRDEQRTDKQTRADYAFVRGLLGSSTAMMDAGHVFRHYVGTDRISDLSFNSTQLLVRRAGQYEPISIADLRGKLIGLLSTRTNFLGSAMARDLSDQCTRIDRPTVVLWDCR